MNIVAFRDFLRARFPEAHAPQPAAEAQPVAGGASCIEALDLRKGAVTEVVVPAPGSGAGLLIAGLLQREGACREPTALVDGADAFDPWSLTQDVLERVLWVRCCDPAKAIRATDLLLRDGNIPLVVLDLQAHPVRTVQGLPSSTWHRLRMLAEKSGACLCTFTPARAVPCAQTRALVRQRWSLMDQYREHTELLASLPLQIDRQRPRATLPAAMKATA
ncbi:MAG: hypothetical protein K1X78_16760 [Verrucomicrobiaceae bacterium]|nr:hypothetical protein [Verrucomicrobiaceae bacterium]